jgi:hypothetical protein
MSRATTAAKATQSFELVFIHSLILRLGDLAEPLDFKGWRTNGLGLVIILQRFYRIGVHWMVWIQNRRSIPHHKASSVLAVQ